MRHSQHSGPTLSGLIVFPVLCMAYLIVFFFFLMENSEPGSSLQSADEPIILGLMHHFFC